MAKNQTNRKEKRVAGHFSFVSFVFFGFFLGPVRGVCRLFIYIYMCGWVFVVCLSLGGSSRCRSPRWGVRSLRSVSPRLVAPSAPSLERGQSLCGHRCAPFGLPRSPRPPSSPLRSVWAGCERPRVVRSLLPCGVFVVRGSLAVGTIASPSARLLMYFCKVKFTDV